MANPPLDGQPPHIQDRQSARTGGLSSGSNAAMAARAQLPRPAPIMLIIMLIIMLMHPPCPAAP